MARPIKETPILIGKNASKFQDELKLSQGKKIDPKTKERIKQNYLKLNSIAKF